MARSPFRRNRSKEPVLPERWGVCAAIPVLSRPGDEFAFDTAYAVRLVDSMPAQADALLELCSVLGSAVASSMGSVVSGDGSILHASKFIVEPALGVSFGHSAALPAAAFAAAGWTLFVSNPSAPDSPSASKAADNFLDAILEEAALLAASAASAPLAPPRL